MLPPLCRARRSTPSPRIRGGTSADRPAAPPAHGAPIPAATHFRSALARAANGQQTSETGFPQPCEIEPREAQKAASTERSRVHRRHPSRRSKRPVTPEVAGSSPVAPVNNPCNLAYCVASIDTDPATSGSKRSDSPEWVFGAPRPTASQPGLSHVARQSTCGTGRRQGGTSGDPGSTPTGGHAQRRSRRPALVPIVSGSSQSATDTGARPLCPRCASAVGRPRPRNRSATAPPAPRMPAASSWKA